jgi:formylmethanofuran:tetrahydromethanopterin formyltransferase
MPPGADIGMEFEFSAEVIEWRGPAPFYFAPLPEAAADAIAEVSGALTYGWGVIPAAATIGSTRFTTALFPRNGGYLLPLKDAVRTAEHVKPGDLVSIELVVGTTAP